MATKKNVGVHRALLLSRTSVFASVLTLEVPLPAVQRPSPCGPFSYTYVTSMTKNQIDLHGIRTSDDLTILNFGIKSGRLACASN